MKRGIKLYNMIFPVWLLLFFPPVILITLFGNYIIDSLVVTACFFVYKLANLGFNLKIFYKECILKVWLYGFLADFIGATILFLLGICGDRFGLPYELVSAICYDPFSHPLAVVITVSSIVASAALIFLFNYRLIFRNQIQEHTLRRKIALSIAVFTAPWTFLIPTKWFY
ncbi:MULTISPECIES: hypothetical protein [Tepidanaerobacter]|uniref:hypothetical protein n=1 Tax=Tepidanaerobacter TaxID=499228 RepID=UPI000B29B7A9|nr:MULTISPECIES: hypothetical protein [Tepidanaerobacter]